MAENNKQGIEKALRGTVIVLSIAIIAVMALLTKATFFGSSSAPRSHIEKQLNDAQEAIKENPKDLRAHLMLGITYSQMGKFKEAEDVYLKVIKADKKMTKAYYLLALNYEKQEQTDKAIDMLKKQKDEQSLHQLGRLYINEKEYEKAKDTLKKAVKKRETASDTLYYLGYAYERTNEKDKALKYYKEALKYSPD